MNKVLHTSTKHTIHKEQDPMAMLSESQILTFGKANYKDFYFSYHPFFGKLAGPTIAHDWIHSPVTKQAITIYPCGIY